MPTNVILPALGMAQDTGKILEWLKAEGEQVRQGEAIVVIETDKASVELEAPASGVLARLTAAGSEVPVAEVIAVILAPEEAASGDAVSIAKPARAAEIADVPESVAASANQPANRRSAGAEAGIAAPAAVPEDKRGRRLASPKARRMAAAVGIDLATLRGSGPSGAVLAGDVQAASAGSAPAEVAAIQAALDVAAVAAESELSTTWRLMAERTTQSWTTVPHFFLMREVRANRLIVWRERVQGQTAEKVTYTDLLVQIVAAALRRHPQVNARWERGGITHNDAVNVGIAVAVEDGLVVPVIHRADTLSLGDIASRRHELVERAQSGKLRLSDLQDATFTISNLGMYSVDAFNAIIAAPQAAILAVGRISDRVVPMDGQPSVQPMMTLSLSCDHRVVDGARGAQFLAAVAEHLERPPDV